jgi:hypothetical protein
MLSYSRGHTAATTPLLKKAREGRQASAAEIFEQTG